MRLTITLALKGLIRDRVYLICNVAVLAGVLVPLLVLFGVKNGVYDTLIGRLLSDPASLQIDTSGNADFSREDAQELRSWPETGFVTLKTRSIFDFVNVRPADGRGRRDALMIPSGTGDPTLPEGLALNAGQAVISDQLAVQLGVGIGDTIEVITQGSDRPRQLLIPLGVVAVLPPAAASGRSVRASIETLDLIEAFYDGYALPEHGITAGRPLAERQVSFEGMRIYARDLRQLADLQNRIESRFDIRTEARTREVAAVLGLGRNLDLALLLVTGVAAIGLAAALVFGFWGEVARNRRVLAVLALMGIGGRRLWLFPVVQAVVSAVLGLLVSFALLQLAALVAERLFVSGLAASGGLVQVSLLEGILVSMAVLAFVTTSAVFAARAAARVDPALVLREASA